MEAYTYMLVGACIATTGLVIGVTLGAAACRAMFREAIRAADEKEAADEKVLRQCVPPQLPRPYNRTMYGDPPSRKDQSKPNPGPGPGAGEGASGT